MATAGRCSAPAYDVVLVGKVYTGIIPGGDEISFAECIAFSRGEGVIVFVGLQAELSKHTEDGKLQSATWCRRYVFDGLLLPAFHDAHCHPFGAGNRSRNWDTEIRAEDDALRKCAIDLKGCEVWPDVLKQLGQHLDDVGANECAEVALAENCKPDVFSPLLPTVIHELNELASNRPLVVLLKSKWNGRPEAVVVSSSAMRALQAKVPEWHFSCNDDRIGRGTDGQPTGFFAGPVWSARFSLLSSASVASQAVRGLRDGLLMLPKDGVVACTDAFVFEDRLPCYEMAFLEDKKRLLPRTSLALGFKEDWSPERYDELLTRAASLRTEWMETDFRYCLREAKIEVDHSCWSATGSSGGAAWDLALMDRIIVSMIRMNFSMHLHVFGNLAAQHSIRALKAAEVEACKVAVNAGAHQRAAVSSRGRDGLTGLQSREPEERRHKLAHVFELLSEDAHTLCQTPCIYVVYQPYWFHQGYDDDTARTHRDLISGGASVCYGSDWDITTLSPLHGISAALSHTKWGHPREPGIDPTRPWQMRLAQTVRLYTLEAARAMWMDDHSGTVEVGKFADFCIVDRDIFGMEQAEFCSEDKYTPPPVQVNATFSRGFCIFRRDATLNPPILERIHSQALSGDAPHDDDFEFLCGTCFCAASLAPFVCCT